MIAKSSQTWQFFLLCNTLKIRCHWDAFASIFILWFVLCHPFTLLLIHSLHLMIKFYYCYRVLLFYYYHLRFFSITFFFYYSYLLFYYYYIVLLLLLFISSFTIPFYSMKSCKKESVRWEQNSCLKAIRRAWMYIVQNWSSYSGISLSLTCDLPSNLCAWNSLLHTYLPMDSADKIQ